MPRFPQVASSSDGLTDRVFSRLAARAKERGGLVHPLHVGDTWLEPLDVARAEAQRTESFPRLHNYAPVQGEPALIDAILRHVDRRAGVRLDRELVQVMSGATAALSVIADALIEPGEEVLIPAPFWPLIRGTVRRRGGRAIEVPFFDRLSDPAFDPEAVLEARVTPRTVAIYVNTPHNPTGAMLPERALAAIARLAKRHDLWILSDEVYEDLYFTSAPPEPAWAREDFRGRTIVVHSLSKAFGLAGARVGFAHGPAEAMQAIRGVQTFSTYCAPRPMQLGAARALDEGAAWLENARRLYRDAAERTAATFDLPAPMGGTFLFADVRPYRREGEDTMGFLERCLDEGVLLTPGSASGTDYEGWARVCFTSVPPDDLRDALARLRRVLGR
ncbi:pyridoxal phosphate-dependent aminotransferase [Sandaracinus amylolyticus]|uniref:Aminotransferase n=1 Tax=Sandaracinus amylolyticus TaxID=927083 RepID=A0A0F6W5W7_9BACT|nr:pyridoxal phosphate-dependent aminotransferase [Sandaracinus amylolyticus]AKF08077.1 Glutamine-dependent 2-keto-4-methylthiobutyrate transaminase [Sandaracinus amylolyticus]